MAENSAVQAFWRRYCDSLVSAGKPVPEGYTAWGFGDSPTMADELGALVIAGTKTATASLGWVYESGYEVMPQVGDLSVILNGAGEPLCVIETIEIRVKPFDEVDTAFAYDEGEGDRSLAYWREAHSSFFARECTRLARTMSSQMPVVCERFRVVF
ncbi:MAG: ASCH domain-containing protein [Anaerolineae bacterium]